MYLVPIRLIDHPFFIYKGVSVDNVSSLQVGRHSLQGELGRYIIIIQRQAMVLLGDQRRVSIRDGSGREDPGGIQIGNIRPSDTLVIAQLERMCLVGLIKER